MSGSKFVSHTLFVDDVLVFTKAEENVGGFLVVFRTRSQCRQESNHVLQSMGRDYSTTCSNSWVPGKNIHN